VTKKNWPSGRKIDVRDVTGKFGPKIAAFLLVSALEDDRRAFTSAEISAALGMAYERKQWGRNMDHVRKLLGPDLLDGPHKGSKGPWRIVNKPEIVWRLHGQPATLEKLRIFAGLTVPLDYGPVPIVLETLSAEMCELVTSAERRYRSGALVRALDAVVELEHIVDNTDLEMVLSCKLRKLRVLHRLNHWDELEAELRWLARVKAERQIEDDVDLAMHLMHTLYTVWHQYNKVRPDSDRRMETFINFHDALEAQLEEIKKVSLLKHQLQCEVLNLSILLRRRLLCEFDATLTADVTRPNRHDWAMEACKRSLSTIKKTLLQGDFELMGNYCANYAYLLASLHHKEIFRGPARLWDAFRWMTVSDRIAARLGAGADNFWSPIYWLYMRRVAHAADYTWGDISGWLRPIVHRTGARKGPRVPNPAPAHSCFAYVSSTCM